MRKTPVAGCTACQLPFIIHSPSRAFSLTERAGCRQSLLRYEMECDVNFYSFWLFHTRALISQVSRIVRRPETPHCRSGLQSRAVNDSLILRASLAVRSHAAVVAAEQLIRSSRQGRPWGLVRWVEISIRQETLGFQLFRKTIYFCTLIHTQVESSTLYTIAIWHLACILKLQKYNYILWLILTHNYQSKVFSSECDSDERCPFLGKSSR